MTITMQFLGAAGTVTGSRFLIRSDKSTILIDAGMFQGLKELRLKNWDPFPINPAEIDAIVLTHAHLDHCGYIPALVAEGFTGAIFATEWTAKLAEVVMRDSAKIQMEDAEYAARKGYSKHASPRALYDERAVEKTVKLFKIVEFRESVSISPDASIILRPAGHILGAAFAEVNIGDKRMLFTGDMGRPSHPLLRAPDDFPGGHFDAVVTESTYGDRTHEGEVALQLFADTINRTLKRGGSILIPAFAVDRTEVVLMELRRLMDQQLIPRAPIWVDSPMALTALRYYRTALSEESSEIRSDMANGYADSDPFDSGTLREAHTVADSKLLNDPHAPCIIVSASGMATGGRVVHHLEGMLPDPLNTVMLVGYQAVGTRGRSLVDGATSLKMYGRYVQVRAEIVQAGGFSVHADGPELIEWLGGAESKPSTVYVVHGEDDSAKEFRNRIENELDWLAVVPKDQERVVV